MRFVLTALIFLAGMLDLWLGAGFLFTPTTAAAGFGLAPNGAMGLAVLRADFTAFFWVSAVCMMVGAWRRNGDLLLVPAMLFGVAFSGRLVSVFADGTVPGFWLPMTVEAFHVVLLLTARRLLPHHTVDELTG
jgi:hypothetical protein